jgi:hypothetical protein
MSPEVTAAWITVGGVVLTVIATVVVQISLRRATNRDTQKAFAEQREQLDRTLAEQREQLDRTLAEQPTRALNERFATAAEQLGSDKPPEVQLAGVYAMAGLADDWPENRQTCVDVLCAYLRLPYKPDSSKGADPRREARHTVIRVITAHLKAGAAVSWQGPNFDFMDVIFDGIGHFADAEFSGGTVDFRGAMFSGYEAVFSRAVFSGGTVDFRCAKLSASHVSFRGAKFSGGKADFCGAKFSSSSVDFDLAEFSGGKVRFFLAEFSGKVDFSSPGDWSVPPAFPWTSRDVPPRGVKLPPQAVR